MHCDAVIDTLYVLSGADTDWRLFDTAAQVSRHLERGFGNKGES
jgi:hypothetical protein